MTDELQELQSWYESQCDGDWEHTYGMEIGTLDNPGWGVEIDLAETELEGRAFVKVSVMEPEREWLTCEVAGRQFRGMGGSPMLGRILRTFLDWAREAHGESVPPAGTF